MSWLRRHKQADDAELAPGYVTAGSLGRSANGTPLAEIMHTDVDCDPQIWSLIPTVWDDYWKSPHEWAAQAAELAWGAWHEENPGSPEPDPTAIARTTLELESYAEKWGGFRPLEPFDIVTYLHQPSPTVSALPVRVFVDDTPGLTAEAGAAAPDAAEPPVVVPFTTDALGTGLKATAHGVLDPEPDDLPGTRGVWVQLRYAFKVPDRQAVVIVTCSYPDPARVTAAEGDIDEFVRRVTIHKAGALAPPL